VSVNYFLIPVQGVTYSHIINFIFVVWLTYFIQSVQYLIAWETRHNLDYFHISRPVNQKATVYLLVVDLHILLEQITLSSFTQSHSRSSICMIPRCNLIYLYHHVLIYTVSVIMVMSVCRSHTNQLLCSLSSHAHNCSHAACTVTIVADCFLVIWPLSSVPLWSGSNFGAFVYIGNDGCMFWSWL